MSEVASATIALLPTFKGGTAAIERALGTSLDQAGAKSGSSFSTAFNKKLTTGIKLGVAGLVGAVAFKGVDRLLDIDNAEAKLRGFGNTTEQVAGIMDSALSSVKGTAFGLGDAATVAAAAVGAGVGRGEVLTKYLTLTADAAAAAGTSLSEMGQIINGTTTTGRVYGDQLNQLAARGLPIFSLLQKEYGVTAETFRNMVSDGKIDAQTFQKVLQEYVGGSALKAGETIQGSFDNLLASLGRVGANLLGGGAEELPKFFTDLTKTLQPVEQTAKVVGTAVGQVTSAFAQVPPPVLLTAAALALLVKFGPRIQTGFRDARFEATKFAGQLGLVRTQTTITGATFASESTRLGSFAKSAKGAGGALLGLAGGPAGLAVGLGVTAITAAFTSWTDATEAQKQAIADLSATLDENTGKVTAATTQKVAEDLDKSGVLQTLEKMGVATTGLAGKITGQVDGYKAVKEQLQGIIAAEDTRISKAAKGDDVLATSKVDTSRLDSARTALSALESKYGDVGKSTEDWRRVALAAGQDVSGSVPPITEGYKSLSDAVKDALSQFSNVANQNSGILDLAKSVAENGKVVDNTTAKGIANANALQSTISAMADAAGGDTDKFAMNVIGLLRTLDSQGVDTSKVIGSVSSLLERVSGSKYKAYLDGSQAISEAKKIAHAALVAAKTLALADPKESRGAYSRLIEANAELARIDAIKSSASQIGQVYNSFTQSATRAAGAAKSAGKSAKDAAKEARDAIKAALLAVDSALDGFRTRKSARSSEASAVRDSILDLYNVKGVKKAVRNSVLKFVDVQDARLRKIASNREGIASTIEKANAAIDAAISQKEDARKAIADGYKALGDLTKLAQASQDAVTTYTRIGDTIYGSQSGQAASAATMIENLKKQVDQARLFKDAYQKLTASGLNNDSLKDLTTGFLSSGDSSIAESVLKGGSAAIKQINDLEAQLGGLGASLGTFASNDLYNAGIATAQGFLKGLQSQDKSLLAAYNKIADDLVKTVRKKLGIHSPSTVMADLAQNTSDGWNNNLHFDAVTPTVGGPGSSFPTVSPEFKYQQVNITFERERTDSETLNDKLAMAGVSFV